MYRKLLREYFLLSRGEQRSMIMVSLLLILSLGVRVGIQLLPGRESPDMEAFRQEARLISEEFSRMDSLEAVKDSLASRRSGYRKSRAQAPKISAPIELNLADSASLLPLPGIGPVFAGRIIKYRDLLGGYVRPEQLMEVYGMDSARFMPLTSMVSADTALLRKMDLNQASFRDLLRHPYLEYEDVKALANYRDRVGHIKKPSELHQNFILPEEVYRKLRPYLEAGQNGL